MQHLLAWQSLTHNKARTVAAVAGIAFAITLIFVQLGMKASVVTASRLVYDRLNFDLVLASPHFIYINKAGTFPRRRLYQAAALSGVETAVPLYVALAVWRNAVTSYRDYVQLVGFNPRDRAFRFAEVEAQMDVLQQTDTVLIDRRARKEAGPTETGVVTEIGQRRIRIGGQFTLGAGFTALGTVIVSDQNFSRILNGAPLHQVSFGLVKLAPGADLHGLAEQLRRQLPPDVQVMTRAELNAAEKHYWIEMTSTGIVLHTGVLMALLVGTVVLYQVLATDISNRLSEYATLKALGHPNLYLSRVVLEQGFFLAMLGFVPALALAFGLYAVMRKTAHIPVDMTVMRIGLVWLLAVGMCSISALAALRRAKYADPAELF